MIQDCSVRLGRETRTAIERRTWLRPPIFEGPATWLLTLGHCSGGSPISKFLIWQRLGYRDGLRTIVSMSKVLHSRHNKIFLDKLRKLRESRQLRQADLGKLLGRSQGWVSYVECGQTALNIIELREWLEVLGVEFMEFLNELDAELRLLESIRLRAKPRHRSARSALSQLVQASISMGTTAAAPVRAAKPAKRQVRR